MKEQLQGNYYQASYENQQKMINLLERIEELLIRMEEK